MTESIEEAVRELRNAEVVKECGQLRRAIGLTILSETRYWPWTEEGSGPILLAVLAFIVADMVKALAAGMEEPGQALEFIFVDFMCTLANALPNPESEPRD